MSDELHRRRRLTPKGPRRSPNGGGNLAPWIVTLIAAIVVIVGGWFLGQGLARMMGPKPARQTAQRPPAVTPLPMATALPSPAQTPVPPTPKPTPVPTARPTPTPVPATPTPAAVAAATETPVPQITAAPAAPAPEASTAPTAVPAPVKTMRPRTTIPVARHPESTPAPARATAQQSTAAGTVRAYIDALKNGEPERAAMYLGNGSPDEDFINAGTRIASLTSTPNGDGSYKVDVDMKTSRGEYFETFVVADTSNGSRILEKTAIKP